MIFSTGLIIGGKKNSQSHNHQERKTAFEVTWRQYMTYTDAGGHIEDTKQVIKKSSRDGG